MRYAIPMVLLVACSSETVRHIDGGPYSEAQVRVVMQHVASTMADRFPGFLSDLEAYGYSITATRETWCGESGCASAYLEDGTETVRIEFSPGTGTCIGATQLPHELLHAVVYLYDLAPGHEEPGFWGLTDTSSYEYIAATRGLEDCQ